MGHDPRDPRADSQQWPCFGAHTPSKPHSWSLGALHGMQPTSPVRAKEGKHQRLHESREPSDDPEDAAATAANDERLPPKSDDLCGHGEADRSRGGAAEPHQPGDGCSGVQQRLPVDKGKVEKVVSFDTIELTSDAMGRGGRCLHAGGGLRGSECQQRQRGGDVLKNDLAPTNVTVPQNPKVPENDLDTAYIKVTKNAKVSKNVKDANKTYELTHRLAAKVMFLATTMLATATTMMASFALDDRDGLWEMACSPHSWLSEAAQMQGLHPRRINLQSGYDLYKKETWDHLRALRRKHRPRRLWWSLPCTFWCQWSSLNYVGPERQQLLEEHRRRERRLLWYAHELLTEALADDPELLVYYEWPHPCFGWKQKPLLAIQSLFEKHGHDWLDVVSMDVAMAWLMHIKTFCGKSGW